MEGFGGGEILVWVETLTMLGMSRNTTVMTCRGGGRHIRHGGVWEKGEYWLGGEGYHQSYRGDGLVVCDGAAQGLAVGGGVDFVDDRCMWE
jgi:hypothetical protein